MLAMATELNHPDPTAPLALTTDASSWAVGGTLEQHVNGTWRPLGFWSRHLPEDKRQWSTFRRETYALQQAIRHFHTEIEGRHLIVWTDHNPLVQAFRSPQAQKHDVIALQHINEISQWTSDVRFISGRANAVSDFLSRPPQVPIGTAYQ